MAARIRQAEAPSRKAAEASAPPLKFSRIGFDFMGTVLACALLGWLADRTFGSKPWVMLAMLVIGFAVGIMNVWRALSRG
jgi:ATP synthase protein I